MPWYDKTSIKSIESYAKRLLWAKLRNFLPDDFVLKEKKGWFWQILEKYYFWYELNSNSWPDFPEAGIELKSTPVFRWKKWSLRSKERLVLNIINYLEIVEESWGDSSFQRKNSVLLLIFYLYERGQLSIDYLICMIGLFRFSDYEYDLEIIKNDWNIIVSKVREGKAHEISEWDTMYLWACTKWATAESSYRSQPYSHIKAKQRAFSFKQGYMNSVFERISWWTEKQVKLFDLVDIKKRAFEDNLISLFTPYIGKTAYEIAIELGIDSRAKSRYHLLSNRILWIDSEENVEEFKKANIKMKTIRLKPNWVPKEDISFPTFKFKEIVSQEWEDSDLYELLEQNKFFFVIYKITASTLSEFNEMNDEEQDKYLELHKVILWNAPAYDIENMAKETWLLTRDTIQEGVLLEERGWRIMNNLPWKSKTNMIHVRPHGKNRDDTDELPDGRRLTKQCFWFNGEYIKQALGV